MQHWNLRQCEARGVFNDAIFFFQWSDQTFLFPKDACSLCQWLQEISCHTCTCSLPLFTEANHKGMNLFILPFLTPSSYGSILWFSLTKKSNTTILCRIMQDAKRVQEDKLKIVSNKACLRVIGISHCKFGIKRRKKLQVKITWETHKRQIRR